MGGHPQKHITQPHWGRNHRVHPRFANLSSSPNPLDQVWERDVGRGWRRGDAPQSPSNPLQFLYNQYTHGFSGELRVGMAVDKAHDLKS